MLSNDQIRETPTVEDLETLERLRLPRIATQKIVALGIRARGYREGWNDGEFAARQVIKAVEELAELGDCFDLPLEPVAGGATALALLGQDARTLFDAEDAWRGAGPDFETSVDAILDEIADVMIPLFALADVLGGDVLRAVERKVVRDVARGVRGS